MLATVYCNNGSGSLTLNTGSGFFEIKLYLKNKTIYKKYLFYKVAMKKYNKLLQKYNLK